MATRSIPLCQYPGCSKSGYVENDGYVHDYCGKIHADLDLLHKRTIKPMIKPQGSFVSVPRQSETYTSRSSSTSSKKEPLKGLHGILSKLSLSSHSHRSSHDNEILFYHWGEPYYEFTNFYPRPVKVDSLTWPTSEHYFQAQKFIGTPYCEQIRKLSTPREAFQLSRYPSVSRWLRKDWANVKDDVMLKVLMAKFTQHEDLKRKLLETKDRTLIEHTDRDSYWGDGGDGSGLNKLGKLLMQVRHFVREKENKQSRKLASPKLRRASSCEKLDLLTNEQQTCTYDSSLRPKRTSSFSDYRRPRQTSYALSATPISSSSSQGIHGLGHIATPTTSRRVVTKSKETAAPPRTTSRSSTSSSVSYNIINHFDNVDYMPKYI